jgi:hypothetical protein
MEKGLDPSGSQFGAIGVKMTGVAPEVFAAVIEVQSFACFGEPIFDQVPYTDGITDDDEHLFDTSQPQEHCLSLDPKIEIVYHCSDSENPRFDGTAARAIGYFPTSYFAADGLSFHPDGVTPTPDRRGRSRNNARARGVWIGFFGVNHSGHSTSGLFGEMKPGACFYN